MIYGWLGSCLGKVEKMDAKRLSLRFSFALITLVVSACQQSQQSQTYPPDKLKEILERGTLIVAIDPAYPPQSEIIPGATRASDTLCKVEQFTASELDGFDVEVAKEILAANRQRQLAGEMGHQCRLNGDNSRTNENTNLHATLLRNICSLFCTQR
jgi:hypothetical protein